MRQLLRERTAQLYESESETQRGTRHGRRDVVVRERERVCELKRVREGRKWGWHFGIEFRPLPSFFPLSLLSSLPSSLLIPSYARAAIKLPHFESVISSFGHKFTLVLLFSFHVKDFERGSRVFTHSQRIHSNQHAKTSCY